MSEECGCIAQVNADLKAGEHNTMLNTNLFGPPRALLATVQIKTGRGQKKASLVRASHCPFCGVKYPAPADAVAP